MTSDQGNDSGNNGDNRLAPRPISRPPVDPAARQAFGRPAGQQGSFVAERVRPAKFQHENESWPHEQPADPVLAAMGHDPVSLDAIQARTGLDTAHLQARLLTLELDGRVARLPGGLLQRVAVG